MPDWARGNPDATLGNILRYRITGNKRHLGEARDMGESSGPAGGYLVPEFLANQVIDLARAIKKGTFRQDLYFRLKVARLELPPLRERRGDIIPLAEYFLKKHAEDKNQPLPKLNKDSREYLLRNRWEGS